MTCFRCSCCWRCLFLSRNLSCIHSRLISPNCVVLTICAFASMFSFVSLGAWAPFGHLVVIVQPHEARSCGINQYDEPSSHMHAPPSEIEEGVAKFMLPIFVDLRMPA